MVMMRFYPFKLLKRLLKLGYRVLQLSQHKDIIAVGCKNWGFIELLDTGEGDCDDENEDLKAFNEEESKKYGEIGDADSVWTDVEVWGSGWKSNR